MNYENIPCPVCGKPLHEADDVVVCPDCGTPQHRECWFSEGHCANESAHSSGYVWQAGAAAAVTETENPAQTAGADDIPPDTVFCHICGSENPSDMKNCGHCGAKLPDYSAVEYASHGEMRCPYCGMLVDGGDKICKNCGAPLALIPGQRLTESEHSESGRIIGNHTEGELSSFVRKNTDRYIPLFEKFEQGKKLSFNLGAFIFGPMWHFFRKLYKSGIAFILVTACAALFFSTAVNRMNTIIEPYADALNNRTVSAQEMTALSENLLRETKTPLLIGSALLLAANLICAFTADRIYYKKIKRDLDFIKSEIPDANMRRALIIRNGGTSLIGGACAFFTLRIANTVILYIAEFVSNRF